MLESIGQKTLHPLFEYSIKACFLCLSIGQMTLHHRNWKGVKIIESTGMCLHFPLSNRDLVHKCLSSTACTLSLADGLKSKDYFKPKIRQLVVNSVSHSSRSLLDIFSMLFCSVYACIESFTDFMSLISGVWLL